MPRFVAYSFLMYVVGTGSSNADRVPLLHLCRCPEFKCIVVIRSGAEVVFRGTDFDLRRTIANIHADDSNTSLAITLSSKVDRGAVMDFIDSVGRIKLSICYSVIENGGLIDLANSRVDTLRIQQVTSAFASAFDGRHIPRSLNSLIFEASEITNFIATAISKSDSIRCLQFWHCTFPSASLDQLRSCKSLRRLTLLNRALPPISFRDTLTFLFARGCSKLEFLHLENVGISATDVGQLATHQDQLACVILGVDTGLSSEGARTLLSMKSITRFFFSNTLDDVFRVRFDIIIRDIRLQRKDAVTCYTSDAEFLSSFTDEKK